MIPSAMADALDRIAARADDLRDAYRPGAVPRFGDVRTGGAYAPAAGEPLDAVAPPHAWFVARGADGARLFTRDGTFTLGDGTLRTAGGAAVLGYRGDARGTVPEPLTLPASERALGRGGDARIEPDGTVAYTRAAIDPRTGARGIERVVLGRVALARFPAGTAPLRLDATRFAAPPRVEPHLGVPGGDAFAPLATQARDAGALDLDAGLARLEDAYVAFDALRAAQGARGAVDRTVLDLVK